MLWWYDGICCARITVACFEPNFKVHSCQRIYAHIYTHPPNAQKVKSLNATIYAQLNGLISIFKTCVLNVDLLFLEWNNFARLHVKFARANIRAINMCYTFHTLIYNYNMMIKLLTVALNDLSIIWLFGIHFYLFGIVLKFSSYY